MMTNVEEKCLAAKLWAAARNIDLSEVYNNNSLSEEHSSNFTEYLQHGSSNGGDNLTNLINFNALCNNSTETMDNSVNEEHNFTSDEELLEYYLGTRYRSLGESWLLTLVYCGILFTGVVGNISTCIVIYKNNYMHTATNYYLFSLAISDVLTLILGLPPELYAVWEAYPWRLGEPYCLFKIFLTEMTSAASILTITAFTVERYVAICHPIRAQRMSSLSRAVKIIFFIWISACLSALAYPIHTRLYYYVNGNMTHSGKPIAESLICNIPVDWMPKMRAVFQFTTFLLFIFPMTVITVLYLLIGITLRKAGLARKTSAENCAHNTPQSRKVIQMLVAVVVAFFICWAPFHAQRLMTSYITRDEQWTPELHSVQNILWYISGVLYFVSSTVNPILYNLMSRKYRQAFKETLCKSCFKQTRASYQNGYTNTRTRGLIAPDKSTIYSYYSHSSNKKYTSMVKQESHPVPANQNLCNNNNLQNQSLILHNSNNGNNLEVISEGSMPEEENSPLNVKMEPLMTENINSDINGLRTDEIPCDDGSCNHSDHHHPSDTVGYEETALSHIRTSSTKSAANCSMMSGCSLKSSPAGIAEHLKEEMEMSNVFEETEAA